MKRALLPALTMLAVLAATAMADEKSPKLTSVLSPELPPWVLTMTLASGQPIKFVYPSKEACETNIFRMEMYMRATDGHCDPRPAKPAR